MEEHARQVDGPGLRALAEAACTWLATNHEAVNALNVFPVPDGDTGTNMLLTMRSACNEMVPDEPHAGKVAHALAHGALLGARGNSGVILSQILRGLARGLEQHPAFGTAQLVRALHEARNTAYRGVVRPVEGTLLTVIKDVAGAAQQAGCVDGQPAVPGCVAMAAGGVTSVVVPSTGTDLNSTSLWSAHAPLSNGAFFLGELAKFVHVAPQRFEYVLVDAVNGGKAGLVVGVRGSAGQSVLVTAVDAAGIVRVANASLPESGFLEVKL